MTSHSLPRIIQGGMGVGVSNWRLAKAVSRLGHLGVVSGTALNLVLVRRLQLGDPGGHMLRALRHFPLPDVAARIAERFYVPGGKKEAEPFAPIPMLHIRMTSSQVELLVASAFTEVFLAKESHTGLIGINLLEKIQLPTLATLYGAMLAGVHYVLMGAGIPNHIPGVLDAFSQGEPASLRIDASGEVQPEILFNPRNFMGASPPDLTRPRFIPVISSATLALTLARKANGMVDGFIVEGTSAGGHNAPPRGPMQLSCKGEPVYGIRDHADLQKIRSLGLPFWLAGSYGGPGKLEEALHLGASGIQVGTAFAFCEESGITPELKRLVLEKVREGTIEVFTDPAASPTGFPFKVVRAGDSNLDQRERRTCDLGVLREAYLRQDQSIGYRCPSEPLQDYVRKGGNVGNTTGRKCVCNGLLATIGLGQSLSNGQLEPPLITAGDSLADIAPYLLRKSLNYNAADVIRMLSESSPVKNERLLLHS